MAHRSTHGTCIRGARTNVAAPLAWRSARARLLCPCRESGGQPSRGEQLRTPRYRLERTCLRRSRILFDFKKVGAAVSLGADILGRNVLWSLPKLSQASQDLPLKRLSSNCISSCRWIRCVKEFAAVGSTPGHNQEILK